MISKDFYSLHCIDAAWPVSDSECLSFPKLFLLSSVRWGYFCFGFMPLNISMPAPDAAHQFTNSYIHNSTVSPASLSPQMVNPCCKQQYCTYVSSSTCNQYTPASWGLLHTFSSLGWACMQLPHLRLQLLSNTSSAGLRASRAQLSICIWYMNTFLNLSIANKIESDRLIWYKIRKRWLLVMLDKPTPESYFVIF